MFKYAIIILHLQDIPVLFTNSLHLHRPFALHAALKACERFTFTLTGEISDTNDVNWNWGDYVSMTVDEPDLSYGMKTGQCRNLPAVVEGGKNYCGMDVVGDFSEQPPRIPTAQVYLELSEGTE